MKEQLHLSLHMHADTVNSKYNCVYLFILVCVPGMGRGAGGIQPTAKNISIKFSSFLVDPFFIPPLSLFLRPDTTVQIDFFSFNCNYICFQTNRYQTNRLLLLHYKKGCLRCLLLPVVMETKQNGRQTTCK